MYSHVYSLSGNAGADPHFFQRPRAAPGIYAVNFVPNPGGRGQVQLKALASFSWPGSLSNAAVTDTMAGITQQSSLP
jgi:hypothetical protein